MQGKGWGGKRKGQDRSDVAEMVTVSNSRTKNHQVKRKKKQLRTHPKIEIKQGQVSAILKRDTSPPSDSLPSSSGICTSSMSLPWMSYLQSL